MSSDVEARYERSLFIDTATCMCGSSAVVIRSVFAVAALIVWFNQGTVYRVLPFEDCEQFIGGDGWTDCELFINNKSLARQMEIPSHDIWDSTFVTILDDSPVYNYLSETPPIHDENNVDAEYGLDKHNFGWLIAASIVSISAAIAAYIIVQTFDLGLANIKYEMKVESNDEDAHTKSWTDKFADTGVWLAMTIITMAVAKGADYIVNLMTASFTSMSCVADVEGSGVYSAGNLEPARALLLLTFVPAIFTCLCCCGGFAALACNFVDSDNEDAAIIIMLVGLFGYVAVVGVAAIVFRLVALESFEFTIGGIFTGVGGPCVFKADEEFETVQSLLIVTMTFAILGEVIGWTGIAIKIGMTLLAMAMPAIKVGGEYAHLIKPDDDNVDDLLEMNCVEEVVDGLKLALK